jgi:hypothetical protein
MRGDDMMEAILLVCETALERGGEATKVLLTSDNQRAVKAYEVEAGDLREWILVSYSNICIGDTGYACWFQPFMT